jgi:hypothetical protein
MKATIFAVAASVLAFSPIAASAVTVTNIANAPTAWTLVDTTNTLALPTGASWSSAPFVGTETANPCGTGAGCSPFDPRFTAFAPVAGWEDIPFYAVGPRNLLSQPAVLDMGSKKAGLTLHWGSIDARNTMEFFNNGVLVATVTGLDVPAPVNNPNVDPGFASALVKVSGFVFDQVVFTNGLFNGFEFTNLKASPVPLPAAGWMLISAMAGVGFLARNRRAA